MRRIKRFVLAQTNAKDITWKSSDNFCTESTNGNNEKNDYRTSFEGCDAVLIPNESPKSNLSVSPTSLQ